MTTLREIRAQYPALFYPQDWMDAELFMDEALPVPAPRQSPTQIIRAGAVPLTSDGLPLAVVLAAVYVRHPLDPVWSRWLWCADTDRHGQRIFVGGVRGENRRRFEIHRHIHITPNFGVPAWPTTP